jgi:hypothetical protein
MVRAKSQLAGTVSLGRCNVAECTTWCASSKSAPRPGADSPLTCRPVAILVDLQYVGDRWAG